MPTAGAVQPGTGTGANPPGLLVLRPGALGDTLLAVPALRALRAAYPGHRLTLAAHPAASALLAEAGEVHHGRPFDHPSLAWLYGAGPPPVEVDVAIAWLSDPAGRVAQRLRDAGASRVVVAPSRTPERDLTHCAVHLLRSIGVDAAPGTRPLAITPALADDVLIHPGSGAARKNWPPSRFAELVEILRQAGRRVTLVVGEADTAPATAVESALGRPLPRLEQPGLADLAARLVGASVYLGNDSGVSHLAGLVGARTVALFGPTAPEVWRPLGPRVTIAALAAKPPTVARLLLDG